MVLAPKLIARGSKRMTQTNEKRRCGLSNAWGNQTRRRVACAAKSFDFHEFHSFPQTPEKRQAPRTTSVVLDLDVHAL